MSIFGVWMWPKSVRENGAKAVVTRCKRAGVTDIYFLTKGLNGTATFKSDIAPMECERDLLNELLMESHKQCIRVHAWFTSASDQCYKENHPQSGRYHFSRGRDCGLISLSDRDYISYLSTVVNELSRRYPIDGLHLDYIRYNHMSYGWSEDDLLRYASQGADIGRLQSMMGRLCRDEEGPEVFFDAYRAGDPDVLAFARVRRTDVVNFASSIIGAAKAENNRLLLSAALMPEGAYDDIAFSDVHYGQNYEDACRLYNYALPMAYSQAYGKDSAWVRNVALGTIKRGLKTIVGLHAFEGGTGDALRADVCAAKEVPVEGICLFREGACAMAYSNGPSVEVYNPLDEAITGIKAYRGKESVFVECSVQSNEEKTISLAFETENVCAYSGDKEVCIYLHI